MPDKFSPYDIVSSGLRSLRPYDPGKPIEELEREYGVRNAIKVASNENPLGASPKVIRLIANTSSQIHRYPDGSGHDLKNELAVRHNVGADQICLGNGSNDVLDLLARVFVKPGQEGVISRHAFIVYYLSLIYAHAKARVVDAKNYGHDLEAMANAVSDDTAIMFIANPNNPTGTWSTEGQLRQLLNKVPSQVIVVVDEAYAEYTEQPQYPDCTQWLADYPNLVVTRTFSKIYGLAGMRIGYSVSSPQINDLMNRVRHPFNCNSLAMSAALAALEDTDHTERSRQLNREQMQYLRNGFSQLQLDTIESVGNFICVDLNGPAIPAYESLLGLGVITRPVGGYEMPNHLRVSVGTEAENLRVMEAFEKLKELKII
ncbi:MAG: histidinol-phosphate transaminase [Acidiferrobacterales bacterium]|nr:histidinol-phosphate transaminase [Acidiferrobacterales bacterium]